MSYSQLTTQDITPEFVESFYENYIDGWFETSPVDWDAVLVKYEKGMGEEAAQFPDQWAHPVIMKLKREIRKLRNL